MTTPPTVGRLADGERFLAAALDAVDGRDLDGPSLLPGWSRRTLVAHVARNADAIGNLLTWARTGVVTPMYASAGARDADIATTAQQADAALLADCRRSAERLAEAVRCHPPDGWDAEVVTAQGRAVRASEAVWLRHREVWVHAVDLDAGVRFADVPDDVLLGLVDDVWRTWARRDQHPGVTVVAGGRARGEGEVTVRGTLPEVTAWVTGRGPMPATTPDGVAVPVPPWL